MEAFMHTADKTRGEIPFLSHRWTQTSPNSGLLWTEGSHLTLSLSDSYKLLK